MRIYRHIMPLWRRCISERHGHLRFRQLYSKTDSPYVSRLISQPFMVSNGLAVTTRLSNRQCGIPPHKGRPELDSATLVPLIFSTLLFANRIAAKFMGLGGGWGPDDYTIIVAYVRLLIAPTQIRICVLRRTSGTGSSYIRRQCIE